VIECKPLVGGRGGDPRRRRREAAVHRACVGRALQVDPIKPSLKTPDSKSLKLEQEKLLSSFAFNFNLRPYILGDEQEQAAVVERMPMGRLLVTPEARSNTRPLLSSTGAVFITETLKPTTIYHKRCLL